MPRKRQASESLLPTRAPKVPRTSRTGFFGADASASQNEGFLAKWKVACTEVFELGRDTLSHLMKSFNGSESDPSPTPPPRSPPPQLSPSPPPTPIELTAPSPYLKRALPHRAPIPNTYYRSQAPPPSPHQPAVPTPHRMDSRPRMDVETLMPPPSQTPSGSGTATSSSAATSRVSSSTRRTSHPDLGDAFDEADRKHRRRTKSVTPKKHRRDHIFAEAHKLKVRETREKDKAEMAQELYELKRAGGYDSDYSTFQTWLNYRARLEKLDSRKTLSPSPSLPDLRRKPLSPETSRRPLSTDVTPDFLQRALEKAKMTLYSPKPPKPFVPSYDQLHRLRLARDEEIERRIRGPKRVPLPVALPPDEEAKVNALFNKRGVIARVGREQVSDRDLSRLQPAQWLNDEIINFYGQMILSRAEGAKENPAGALGAKGINVNVSVNGSGAGAPNGINGVKGGAKGGLLDVHYFSTFFWSKLKGEGYEKARLAKWTKRIDIFSKDVILIPVNHNNSHWTGAAINFRRKRIESYDSMGMSRQNVLKLLREYLDAEHRNKKKKPFDFTGWVDYAPEDTPQQENGFDCGVFTCQFMEALARGEEGFNFTQKDMPYLRRRMVWEIGHTQLRGDS